MEHAKRFGRCGFFRQFLDTENYDSATNVEYALELKENATGTDPVTGKVKLEDYEWKASSGSNVQTINSYKDQDRHVGDKINYEKYKTTVDVTGEIVSSYDPETDEWTPEGEVTTKVVDSIMKKWYTEEESEIELFGETLTLKEVNEGSSNDTLELEEIMTAVAVAVSGELDFVYRGTGERRFKGTGTQRQETSGSDIASYKESETEWVDRTIKFEIPENSESNEWNVVEGKGKSGGSRSWEYQFSPDRFVTITGVVPFEATMSFQESASGFYSDVFQGEEILDMEDEIWELIDGKGVGFGFVQCHDSAKIDKLVQRSLFLDGHPAGINGIYLGNNRLLGAYSSYDTHLSRNFMTTIISVDNGEWELQVFGKKTELSKEGFATSANCDIEVEDFNDMMGVVEEEIKNKYADHNFQDRTEFIVTDWMLQQGEYEEMQKTETTTNIRHLEYTQFFERKDYYPHFLLSQIDIRESFHYESRLERATTPSGETLDYCASGESNGNRIDKSILTNKSDGTKSECTVTKTYDSTLTQPLPGETIDISSHVTMNHVMEEYHPRNCQIRSGYDIADKPYQGFYDNVTNQYVWMLHNEGPRDAQTFSHTVHVSLPDFDFSNGIGLTFGEPLEVPPGTFDNGVDQYLPKAPPPVYEPMDTSGAFVEMPTWQEAFWLGWDAGKLSIACKIVKPVYESFWDVDLQLLEEDRERAWLKAGLAGTNTQYATEIFVDVSKTSLDLAAARLSAGASCELAGLNHDAVKNANDLMRAAKFAEQSIELVEKMENALENGINDQQQALDLFLAAVPIIAALDDPSCFTAGTQVVVGAEYDENGVFIQYVTANIEDIEVGDLVYSYNTLTGEVEQREVTNTLARTSDHINRLTIIDENGHEQTIETTDVHPFWVVTDEPDLSRAARSYADGMYHENLGGNEYGYYVEAKDLRVGDVFLGANGELSTIVATEREADQTNVFNISVDGYHNYYILAKEYMFGQTSVLVHNAWQCDQEFLTDPRDIYFSQDNMDYLISGPSENIEELRDLLASGELDPRDVEPILLDKDGLTGAIYSLDNRRLWAAKEAGTLVNARWATDAEVHAARKLGKIPAGITINVRGGN